MTLAAHATVEADDCYRCGYALHGIADDQPCPECGLLARRSRRVTDDLHRTRPRWLRRITIGVALLLVAIVLIATLPLSGPALDRFNSHYLGAADRVVRVVRHLERVPARAVWYRIPPRGAGAAAGVARRRPLRRAAAAGCDLISTRKIRGILLNPRGRGGYLPAPSESAMLHLCHVNLVRGPIRLPGTCVR